MRRIAIAAVAGLLAVPAQAQDGLNEAAVRDFFNEAVQEAQQLVEAGDWGPASRAGTSSTWPTMRGSRRRGRWSRSKGRR